MGVLTVPMVVELDDGREIEVTVDQRDFAAYEAADVPQKLHTRQRYLAWNALRRTKRYSNTWTAFNTVDCVEVRDAQVEESDDAEEGLDPGQRTPSASG